MRSVDPLPRGAGPSGLPDARRTASPASPRGRSGPTRFALPVLCTLLFIVPRLPAASAAEVFDEANRLYERGQFAEAAATYEGLVRAGTGSPALFFNLGNAYFKAGHVGWALVNYRRAEELAPRDPDIRANLRFARNSVPGAGPRPLSRWSRGLPRLSLNESALLAAGALWLWLGLLTLRQLRPATRKPLRAVTILAGLGAVALAALLAAKWRAGASRTAIVVVPEATVRAGPHAESQNSFTVRDGLELEVLDTRDGWLRVADANRRIGWLQRGEVAMFPPHESRPPGG
jgi:tetratricopeptide (TPR) repeat protein